MAFKFRSGWIPLAAEFKPPEPIGDEFLPKL